MCTCVCVCVCVRVCVCVCVCVCVYHSCKCCSSCIPDLVGAKIQLSKRWALCQHSCQTPCVCVRARERAFTHFST